MNRKLSIAAIVFGVLAVIGELCRLDLPTISWLFSNGSWPGWTGSALLILGGIAGLLWLPREIRWTPVTLQRFRRFRSIGRGWWSLQILLLLVLLALLDQALVGRRALLVRCDGRTYFPAFVKQRHQA